MHIVIIEVIENIIAEVFALSGRKKNNPAMNSTDVHTLKVKIAAEECLNPCIEYAANV